MANITNTCIFFAGGKIVRPETVPSNSEGLQISQNADKTWKLKLELSIPETEAEGVINRFKDFTLGQGASFEDVFDNQVYFDAFNDDEGTSPKTLTMSSIDLTVLNSDKAGAGGQIILRMVPNGGIGKTQNPDTDTKTQNGNTNIGN
jgi:hypothetical protein